MLNAVCQMFQVLGSLLQLELANRLLLVDVTCEVACGVAHGTLGACDQLHEFSLAQAFSLAVCVVRALKERNSKVRRRVCCDDTD